jgi:DASS family divalent anion:Na+ symporter
MDGRVIRGLIVVAIGVVLWFLPAPAGLKVQAWHLFAIFVATIAGFILQPLPMAGVAVVSLPVVILLGVLKPAEALSGFSNTTIWLIVSAFFLAKGFIKTGLGRRIAYCLMKKFGDSTLKVGYALILTDLIVSPATPSNTARAGGILFPIVRSLCTAFKSEPGPSARRIGAYLMQAVFQGNAITSTLFLTAMAGNPLVVVLAAQSFGISISWGLWFVAASVPGFISLLLVPYLVYKLYPPEITRSPEAVAVATAELEKMGPMSRGEKFAAGIFAIALFLWGTSQYNNLDATTVALIAVAAMMVTGTLTWWDILEEKAAWDNMTWMSVIICFANFLTKLGFIPWFAKTVSGAMTGASWIVALVVLLVVYLYSHYSFASLTAHVTAFFVPFATVAIAAGAPPYLTALLFGFFSSLCAILTHYATGPAPIYFGTGYVDQKDWWRLGFILSLVHLIIWIGIGGAWWKIIGLW